MNDQPGEEEIQDQPEGLKPKNRTIILVVILVILAGVLAFLFVQNRNLEEARAEKEEALNQAFIQLDSISNELNNKILTISELGGEIDTLLSIKAQLESEKKDLLNKDKRQQRSISALRDRVGGYKELLLLKDEEIKQLKVLNDQLMTENSELKTEAQELNQSIRSINEVKSQLEEKVAQASRLAVEGLQVIAVNDKGREREAEFRNRHIDQLKIQFYVSENSVAPIEGKELLVRVIAPDGNVLFDVTRGSGSFFFEARELFYTVKKEILYDKSRQQVVIYYEKGSDFALGLHQVEVYTDDYLMGKGTFNVK
ncbi:MAG: chromosome segregation protein SMC [Cyclobacteriaceae bacterium]|nr:chromosome segregation protein SMC [Cyclobacteriaceae bacterium HetDA_MAG_MS6]